MKHLNPAVLKKVEQKIDKRGPDECWPWTGAIMKGYGTVSISSSIKYLAHRIVYFIYKGDFDQTLEVCHSCDTPACCNPAHLFIGHHRINMDDMLVKRRNRWASKGRLRTHADFSYEHAEDIRKRYIRRSTGVRSNARDLMKEFNIGSSTLSRIVTNQTWVSPSPDLPHPTTQTNALPMRRLIVRD